jgi:ParB family transcriptional regulator, chromosome partitioning protein
VAKNALGRGLGALLGGSAAPAIAPGPAGVATPAPSAQNTVDMVELTRIQPCSFQPRKDFSQESLQELADSIREQGIVQPLIVRRAGDRFELIAGERRWRAAQLAGLSRVPIVVREADDRTVLELALVENLQRENLNPMEEAQGYAQLIEQFQLTQEQAAVKVGKSRALVANALRLLKLSEEVQAYLRHGQLSVGHAKVILGVSNAEDQNYIAQRCLKDGLSVRQVEDYVAHYQGGDARDAGGPRAKATPAARDANVESLESRLREKLGTKVTLRYRKGKGSLDIRFFSDEELERVLAILGVAAD